jgi:hypothetical protein
MGAVESAETPRSGNDRDDEPRDQVRDPQRHEQHEQHEHREGSDREPAPSTRNGAPRRPAGARSDGYRGRRDSGASGMGCWQVEEQRCQRGPGRGRQRGCGPLVELVLTQAAGRIRAGWRALALAFRATSTSPSVRPAHPVVGSPLMVPLCNGSTESAQATIPSRHPTKTPTTRLDLAAYRAEPNPTQPGPSRGPISMRRTRHLGEALLTTGSTSAANRSLLPTAMRAPRQVQTPPARRTR